MHPNKFLRMGNLIEQPMMIAEIKTSGRGEPKYLLARVSGTRRWDDGRQQQQYHSPQKDSLTTAQEFNRKKETPPRSSPPHVPFPPLNLIQIFTILPFPKSITSLLSSWRQELKDKEVNTNTMNAIDCNLHALTEIRIQPTKAKREMIDMLHGCGEDHEKTYLPLICDRFSITPSALCTHRLVSWPLCWALGLLKAPCNT